MKAFAVRWIDDNSIEIMTDGELESVSFREQQTLVDWPEEDRPTGFHGDTLRAGYIYSTKDYEDFLDNGVYAQSIGSYHEIWNFRYLAGRPLILVNDEGLRNLIPLSDKDITEEIKDGFSDNLQWLGYTILNEFLWQYHSDPAGKDCFLTDRQHWHISKDIVNTIKERLPDLFNSEDENSFEYVKWICSDDEGSLPTASHDSVANLFSVYIEITDKYGAWVLKQINEGGQLEEYWHDRF